VAQPVSARASSNGRQLDIATEQNVAMIVAYQK
jgi:hypothetical protein